MQIEYEAKFYPIDKINVRKLLTAAGAKQIRAEFIQRRYVFNLPGQGAELGRYIRVRDEGEQVTITLKEISGEAIQDQKELNLVVADFDTAVDLLERLGCERKAYQETKRELWELADCEVTLDEWPYLEPFVEIEGASEEAVRSAALQLGFEYSEAIFGAVDLLYKRKYNISRERINHETPVIRFDMDANPFV